MSELKVSVSGIRGIWGDSLTLQSLMDYTKAFGLYLIENKGKKVLLGRDARPTGELISVYTASILNAMGLDVTDIGIVPTPTVLYGVREFGFDGGLIITASHNPIEWNALKFVKKGGVFTGEQDVEKIKGFLNKPFLEASYGSIGKLNIDKTIADKHCDLVLSKVNTKLIQTKKYTVVLDPVNSAGSVITQKLLESLGCKVIMVNGAITGRFERGTEPTPANLKHLESIVKENKADIAFAQDPDADRLVVVNSEGKVLSEETTLALAVMNVLGKQKGDVVINLSTSMVHEHLAQKAGVKCYRTKVGEANVVEGIVKHKALIGGEGNGGVIYPAINCARDSLAGIGLILELMAETGNSLTELTAALPEYTMVKEKFDFKGDLVALIGKIKGEFPLANINEQDGLRLDWKENGTPVWIHVRASNTEPVVRVIGESLENALVKAVLRRIENLLN